MRVDVHTHFLPPGFFDLMSEHGASQTLDSFSVFGPMLRGGAEHLFSSGTSAVLEDWIGQMDQCSVDLAVLSVGALQPYFPGERTAATVTRQANVMLRDAVDRGQDRFAAFGSLPLPHVGPSLAELRFCLDDCGFAGINLGTSACGYSLDSPVLDELWAALDERGTTVFIHPGTTPLMGVGSADFHLAPDFCSPTETALALCRLVVSKVTTRYPNVQIIAAALGGSIPFFAHRFDTGMRRSHQELYEELGGVLPHLRRFWYDTSMTEEPYALESVRRSIGTDRLVFGSDLPRGPLAEALGFIVSSPALTGAEKSRILDVHGAQALSLDRPAPATGSLR